MLKAVLIITSLLLAISTASAATKQHSKSAPHAAPASKFSKVCAETWPRYLAAAIQEGIDDFGETMSPEEIERDHRAFIARCNKNGVPPDDMELIQEFGK